MAGLLTLAVTQPLLDLIASGPEFLVAHRLSPTGVYLLVAALAGVPVLGGGLVALAVRVLPPATAAVVAGMAVGGSAGLIALLGANRIPAVSGMTAAAVAVLAAVFVAWSLLRFEWVRQLGALLGVAPVVVVAWFLWALPSSLLATSDEGDVTVTADDPVPVVIVILDELPLFSLVDGTGELLSDRYPGFARLAADAVWYRNAITVATSTTEAVPAILSGRRVAPGLVPTAADHPGTLLTSLAGTYDVDSLEPVTDLCPPSVCRRETPTAGSWATLASDLTILYGHLALPARLSQRLPPVDHAWAGFGATVAAPVGDDVDIQARMGEAVAGDRRLDVVRFLEMLTPKDTRPLLRIAHLVFPHRPWEFTPSGGTHGDRSLSGKENRGWSSDPYLVATGWRRHLLQVGYTDTVIGRLIERLDEKDMYEETLLVVVADHGVTFAPDVADMRVTNEDTVASILPVPLFVKYPEGFDRAPPPGSVSDVRAETTDIVPTVYDVIGVIDDDLDGASLLGQAPAARSGSVVSVRDEFLAVPLDMQPVWDRAAHVLSWFPGGDPWALTYSAGAPSLVGTPVVELDVVSPDGHDWYTLDPTEEGSSVVAGTAGVAPSQVLVLVADGTVAAVTRAQADGDTASFMFLVEDPSALGPLEILAVAPP